MALSLTDLFYHDPLLALMTPRSSTTSSSNRSNLTAAPDGGMLGATDVLEYADRWEFLVDVPGIDDSTLSVELTDANTLAIKGERRHNYLPAKKAKAKDSKDTAANNNNSSNNNSDNAQQCEGGACKMDCDTSSTAPHFDVHRVERSFGCFSRSFKLPQAVDSGAIQAENRNGVLTIRVPKVPTKQPAKIPIAFSQAA
jgi:HSP20 family molecular chaperone IbpA